MKKPVALIAAVLGAAILLAASPDRAKSFEVTADTILARILQIQGHRVLLLDRQKHPRFALGESSTPLAAICLERLAARYGLDDLHALAAWGRWMEHLPHLRRGLKRGFTFYGHEPGRPFTNGPANERRLLVAASLLCTEVTPRSAT